MPGSDTAEAPVTAAGTDVSVRTRSAGLLQDQRIRLVLGILLLALLYRGAAEIGYALQLSGPVAAIVWLPVGVGVAFLYLCGLRYWPGVLLGDLLANDYNALPLGSALGQTAGNLLEVIGIVLLLRAFVPDGDPLGTLRGLGLMVVAIIVGTTVSATVGSLSLWLGDVIAGGDIPRVWRTWWLGDASGALIVLPLALAWGRPSPGWWHRHGAETALLLLAIGALSAMALTSTEPLTYLVFPALIWAALRFGPPGATLSVTVAAGAAIAFTANELGPFFRQPIDDKALSTQLYVAVAALTTLFVGALVGERERSVTELAEAKQREGARAAAERQRIARDLHDSVSQALFSTVLHTKTAERDLEREGVDPRGPIARSLKAIAELTAGAQREMRILLSELYGTSGDEGLVAGLARHAATLGNPEGLTVAVQGPKRRRPLSAAVEGQLFAIGREALANVVKHAAATSASVRVERIAGLVAVEVADDGAGGADPGGGSGLRGLADRVEADRVGAVGGSLDIGPRSVQAEFPCA